MRAHDLLQISGLADLVYVGSDVAFMTSGWSGPYFRSVGIVNRMIRFLDH
jgi:hypothetical protein